MVSLICKGPRANLPGLGVATHGRPVLWRAGLDDPAEQRRHRFTNDGTCRIMFVSIDNIAAFW